jgi:hypothetical protein
MASVPTGNPGGHLHDRQQAVHAGQRLRLHRHAQHRQMRHAGDHARQVRRAACACDDDLEAFAARALGEGVIRSGVRWAETMRAS